MGDDDPRRMTGPGPPAAGGWDIDEVTAALAGWAADAAALDAAAERSRQRWLRQQAGEAATLSGVLVDLAERRARVVLSTRSTAHMGVLVGVGLDFCVVASGASSLVALDAVVSVAPAGAGGTGHPAADGSRGAPLPLRLALVLGLLAAERSPARLVLAGGAVVSGSLHAAGVDVLECRVPGQGGRTVMVTMGAIESCTPG